MEKKVHLFFRGLLGYEKSMKKELTEILEKT